METISYDDFSRLEIRVGTIREASDFPAARKPLYRLCIDFGPDVGMRQSAAGLPNRYRAEELIGMQVVAALNLGSRHIAGFESQCLTLGVPDRDGEPILLIPSRPVPDGGRLY